MIPSRYQFHTFSFLMSLMMSGVMSLVMLTIELKAFSAVLEHWPQAWAVSMSVAFPLSLCVVPFTRRLVSRIVAAE